mgnify:CR=1 FL=1
MGGEQKLFCGLGFTVLNTCVGGGRQPEGVLEGFMLIYILSGLLSVVKVEVAHKSEGELPSVYGGASEPRAQP